MSLGKVSVSIEAQMAGFESDMGRAARVAEKEFKRMEAAARRNAEEWKSTGKALGLLVAAGATAAAYAMRQTITAMDDMSKSAQKVGTSTEEFSKLTYAAGLADVSMETLVGSLGKLTKSQAAALSGTGEQSRVFDALGIAVTGADGKMRQSSLVLADFADRFRDLKGSPEAMAAGFALFGRSFQDMIPLVKDGGQAIRDSGAELEALGGVLSTEAGQNAETFNDNLTRLETAARSLAMQVASQLLPDLVRLSEQWVGMAKDGREVEETATAIADGLRAIGQVIEFLTPMWTAFVDVVRGLTIAMAGTVQVATLLANLDWAGMRAGMEGMHQGRGLAVFGRDKVGIDGTGKKADEGNGRASRGGRRGTVVDIRNESSQAEVDAYTRQLQAAMKGSGSTKSRGGRVGGSAKPPEPSEYEKLMADLASYEVIWEEAAVDASNARVDAWESENKAIADKRNYVDSMLADMQLEIDMSGKSAIEKEKMIALRQADVDAMSAEGQAITDMIDRLAAAHEAEMMVNDLKAMTTDFAVSALSDLSSAGDAFEDFADRIKRMAIQMMAEKAIQWLFGAMFGGGGAIGEMGGLSSLFGKSDGYTGFSGGGYTGHGSRNEPAGVVHKGEVVWSQSDVARAGGVGIVESMRLRGYANGGIVGGNSSPMRSGNVHIEIENKGEPIKAESASATQQSDGSWILKMVTSAVKQGMARGEFDGDMRRNFGVARAGMAGG